MSSTGSPLPLVLPALLLALGGCLDGSGPEAVSSPLIGAETTADYSFVVAPSRASAATLALGLLLYWRGRRAAR